LVAGNTPWVLIGVGGLVAYLIYRELKRKK